MARNLFIEYPKCSMCRKAKQYLIDNNIDFEERNIVENNPNYEELKEWILKSGKDVSKFFNTSGMLYREKELSKKLQFMSGEEKIRLLSSNGMLIKRPLFVTDKIVLSGFRENEWKEMLK